MNLRCQPILLKGCYDSLFWNLRKILDFVSVVNDNLDNRTKSKIPGAILKADVKKVNCHVNLIV